MSYIIEDNVPVPPKAGNPRQPAYPWHKMEDGQSILVPIEKRKSAQASASAWLKRNRPGWRAVSRSVNDESARIWVIAPEPEKKEDAPEAEPENVTEPSDIDSTQNSEPVAIEEEEPWADVAPPA